MASGGLKGGIYNPLSNEQVIDIHTSALEVLERIGMTYETGLDNMLDLVEKAGCKVDRDKGRIYFPRELVTGMAAKAPGEYTLHGREEKHNLLLGDNRVYCGSGGTAVRVLDLDTGQARQTMLKDLYNISRIVDKMEHIHFYQHTCVPHDVPIEDYDVNALFGAMMGTTKHITFGCNSDKGLRDCFKMATLIVGSEAELRKNPIFSISACAIISPLKFCTQSTINLMEAARLEVPTTVTSAPMSGSTAPMTMAGTLLQTHAEELAGITVHQLTNPGAPVLYGGLPAMADMRSMGYQGGGVECGIMHAAIHQLCHYIQVPNYASSGLSDSKVPDSQAGWEKAFTTSLAVMGGCSYIHHAAGMLESMLCVAFEQYIMDDEIIGQSCKILEGITVDEEHKAIAAIEQVGPGGNYLMNPHTMKHLRTEYFQGNGVSDKDLRKNWENNGSKTARDRAREMARAILERTEPDKIAPEMEKEIRAKFNIHLN